MIKKVLLIQPPCTITKEYTKEIQPPLGLAYIAAWIEKEYDVRILDAACEGWKDEQPGPGGTITYGLSLEEIKRRIQDYRPDVVGVSCLFSMQHKNAHAVCQAAKETNPSVITVMGGAHPTALPELVLKDPNVDFCILGEGEYAFKDLLAFLCAGKDVSPLDAVAYKRKGSVIINPKTRYIQDLDELPFPARHLLPMEKYFEINLPHGVSSRFKPNTPLITSRGCPADCVFCSIHGIWGYKFRARSVDNIIAELKLLKETYGIREIQFEDDNITFDKKRAADLFRRMVDERLNLAWTTPNGVALWSLDEDILRLMRQSGCYLLCLAVESGDQKFLNEYIKKPLNLNKVRELVRVVKKLGFESSAFFVVGFPEETREQLRHTFDFAAALNLENVGFYIATPYPGTRLYEQCEKGGFLPKDFCLSNLGVKKATIIPAHFTREEVERMVFSYLLWHRISLLWRHPVVFYHKSIRRFFKSPKQGIAILKKFFITLHKQPL